MNLSLLREWLSWLEPPPSRTSSCASLTSLAAHSEDDGTNPKQKNKKIFIPEKRLCERDYIIIDMLNSTGHEKVSFCVTDPHQDDNPVIFVSPGFCKLTGYDYDDVVGRNCRFLQGPKTEKSDVQRISDALKQEKECSVNLLNYKKDGSTFVNEFYLTQLRTPKRELAYFIGIQVAVDHEGPGQMPSNPGWVYTLGNHV